MFSYENRGTNTYLLYQFEVGEVLDTVAMGMLSNNDIPGLVSAAYYQIDEDRFVRYDVTSKIAANVFLTREVRKNAALNFMGSISETLLSVEDYMIDPRSVMMDLDYIFVDVSSGKTSMICLPVIKDNPDTVDYRGYFRNIITNLNFNTDEDVSYVAMLMNYMNRPGFSLEGLLDMIQSITGSPKKQDSGSKNITKPVEEKKQQREEVRQQTPPVRPVSPPPTVDPVRSAAEEMKQKNSVPDNTVPAGGAEEKKKMSFLDLALHYNKENAAIYKAQKDAEKNAKQQKNPSESLGYAVPGQKPSNLRTAQNELDIPPASSASPKSVNPGTAQKNNINPAPVQTPAPINMNPNQTVRHDSPSEVAMDYGETQVISDQLATETMVLSDEGGQTPLRPYLIRSRNNETIAITKPSFQIGKEPSFTDYCITDNPAVSRSHASIISKEGRYYAVDNNSTNHTYIEGKMIPSSQPTELQNGMHIRLGNEEFEFRLM